MSSRRKLASSRCKLISKRKILISWNRIARGPSLLVIVKGARRAQVALSGQESTSTGVQILPYIPPVAVWPQEEDRRKALPSERYASRRRGYRGRIEPAASYIWFARRHKRPAVIRHFETGKRGVPNRLRRGGLVPAREGGYADRYGQRSGVRLRPRSLCIYGMVSLKIGLGGGEHSSGIRLSG